MKQRTGRGGRVRSGRDDKRSPRGKSARSGGKSPRGGDRPFKKSFSKEGEYKPRTRGFDDPGTPGERPFRKREDGDFKPRSRRSDDSTSPGERRPFRKRDDGDSKPRTRRFDDSKPSGERPYRKREDGDFKPGSGGFRKAGSERSFGKSERREGGFKKRTGGFEDKNKFSRDKKSSSGPPRERREGGFQGGNGEFGRLPKRSFQKRDDGGKWNRKEKHEFYGEKRKPKAHPAASTDGSVRLNKFIANAGICSRREADELITAGVISVNDEVITEMGYKVMPGDRVKYNNELLRSERLVYILLNKPKDFITTTDDPEERKTVMSLIAKACKERVYPVGRLDRNTTGVLLFTNDGDLAKKLTHPSFEIHKVYQVELDRAVKGADMDTIREGIRLEDGTIKADEIVYTTADKDVVGMELHSGKNRIVRRIFEHLGYEVKKLDRVVFAGLTKKDLPRGRWRFLTDMEVANLKMMTGKSVVRS